MANMSYCRFQNTLSDLRDCVRAMRAEGFDLEVMREELSKDEYEAVVELIEECRTVAGLFAPEETMPATERDPSVKAAERDIAVLEAYAASKVQS